VPQLHCSAGNWHDFIRYLIIHWAQRNGYDVYSEPDLGKFTPDLELRQIRPTPQKFTNNAPVVYVEIQKDQGSWWIKQTLENYRGKFLSIFQPMKFEPDTPFRTLKNLVEEQIQMDVEAPKDRNHFDSAGDLWVVVNGHRCKRKNAWKYKNDKTN